MITGGVAIKRGADFRPNRRDVRIARRVLKASQLTTVQVLDYLLFGDDRWTSFQDTGRVRFPRLGGPAPRDGRADVKPKYRDPEDARRTWSGRGNMARWLREKLAVPGAKLEDFAVED